ncbi:hypothetical protein N1851_022206 [Merluccius polli]|uniref:Uncharacterized protein n=1 Tax=Merluccius polli TaxID=89951 RepID=A0AA47MI75_MERPO|nr:hypothetical protein N1851_022206 [Merluccius polli]
MVREKIDSPVPPHTSPCVSHAANEADSLDRNVFQRTQCNDQFGLSIEDELFLDLMDKDVYMDEANCWVAPLPFRPNRPRLPNNRQHAVNRLASLRRMLEKKHAMKEHFFNFMQAMFDADHAEPAPVLSPQQVAIYGLRKAALHGEKEHSSEARQFVMRIFYVDDGLSSFPTDEKAIAILKSTKEMLAESSIKLHKIASNSRTVMDAFPPEERAKNLVDLELNVDPLPLQCSLGLTWNLQSHTFTFRVSREKKPFTRRGILSTVNGLFDPLGYVAPVIIQGKALVRELSAEQAEWDAPLPALKEKQ